MPSLVEISPVVFEKIFFYFVIVFSLFGYYLPLEKGVVLESTSPKNALYQFWLKLAQCSWEDFLNFVNVFSLFAHYIPLENFNPLYPGIICAQFVKIGPVVLEKKIFWFCHFIYYIWVLSPFGKGSGSLFEEIWNPFT